MSSELLGIDCINPKCIHDTIKGYRLHIDVRRSPACQWCGHTGEKLPAQESLLGQMEDDWYRCALCRHSWRTCWTAERTDLFFRQFQKDSAYAQMNRLGVQEPGTGMFVVEGHPTLPIGTDARRLWFREESMPRTSLYFRYRPLAGEKLTPNNVFQCVWSPNATPDERRACRQVRFLTPEEFLEITYTNESAVALGITGMWSSLRCQHCYQPIPLRALSTLTLREVELGD